jgi:transposase
MSIPSHTTARLRCADRHQTEMFGRSLDENLPPDHKARLIWAFVEGLDLSAMYAKIRAVEGQAGQPTIDPRIVLALWLLATTDGVGSARALDRLCGEHIAYRWLCGGVGTNYHTLSDFRVQNRVAFDQLLTDSVGTLLHQGLVDLEEVAQDGVRVRASAGSQSFRRAATLEECLAKAKQQVEALQTQEEEDDATASARQRAARERAARERQDRVEAALREQKALAERRRAMGRNNDDKSRAPRASTTDPQARTMKMPDGGFRPGYNVEFATDTGSGIVVGVDVTNVGSDSGQLAPMMEKIEEQFDITPDRVLADGDFATIDDIEALGNKPKTIAVYAPVKNATQQQAQGIDPYQPKPNDSFWVAAWRKRMGTPEAKAIYKRRSATAEWVNARARNHGLRQFLVRGLEKVKAVALLYALTHNMMQTFALRAKAAAA